MSNGTNSLPQTPSRPDASRDDDMVVFGRYQLFPHLRLLLQDGVRLEVGERALDVLIHLVAASGQVVSKDSLLSRIWSKEVVEENSLQAQISSLRKILGKDRDLIATEFGRGYRFTGSTQPHRAATLALGAPHQAHSGLPRPRSPLIGRSEELRQLNRLLATQCLITLAGPAGVGKTRLAVELASEARVFFPDGVYFADLSQLGNPASVSAALSSALAGLAGNDTQAAPHPHQALLLVDNCEHVARACSEAIEQLLQADSKLSILLTSQTPLGLEGEQVFRINPLSVPSQPIKAAHARDYSAIELFVRRVTAADYRFKLTENNVEQIAALCRALDGVPLALEIAAARVPSLGLAAVTEDLALSSALLSARNRQPPGRHQTLGEALQWSYRLLDASEQTAFQDLAIFPGDFTLSAAEEIMSPRPESSPGLPDMIYGLVEKSLLSLQTGTQPIRYRYLSMLRTYALEQLGDRQASMTKRHAHFVEQRVSQAQKDWMSLPTTQWRRQYEHHIDDIRSALGWAFHDEQHRASGLRILAHSAPFWIQLSLHDEGRQRITEALQKSSSPSMDKHQEMLIQAALATSLTWSHGPTPANGQAWTRARKLALQLGDREMQLQAEYGLWLFHLRGGRYTQALKHGQSMADLALQFSDRAAFLTARRLIGTSYHFLGQHTEALIEIESMLDSYVRDERHGSHFRFGLDQRVAGWAFLARILLIMGNTNRARRAAQLAIEEAMALDHACSLCCALAEGSCTVAALSGDVEEVARVSQELNQIAANHGLGFWGLYGSAFSLWAKAVSKPQEVPFSTLQAALERLRDNGFDAAYSVFLSDFANVMIEQGHSAEAAALINTQLADHVTPEQQWNAPELFRIKAQATLHLSQPPTSASAVLLQALDLARSQQAKIWESRLTP
ncbi:ATP-binding protein [Alcaligenes faecalis]|uniref:Winged helix-turn-helix domain-containing protein n=1 Tax=Alcaligenes faecalis TaxID=511 RepID=A0ABY7N4H6_ALCFA|nr:winged helix-turn-helix domain-containing protein [Alcaligenes faecalis]WBM39029.1 winged helix-turn-helix domain-containing protein [Alcaligenes faecalis]